MKKFLALLMTLVMALGMTTVAWAETSTFCNDGEGCTHQAAINTTHYDTLKSAVSAVTTDTETTITLLCDVTDGEGIEVEGSKKITFDFDGKTYIATKEPAGSARTKNQAFQLLKGSTITMKNGTISSRGDSFRMIVQNYCNLTLENMTLDGTNLTMTNPYTLSNNCGDVRIKGTTINAAANGFAFDAYYWPGEGYTEGVTVTVESGNINGKVEVTRDATGTDDASSKLIVTGGTFTGAFDVGTTTATQCKISGGSFTTEVTKYVADNTVVIKDGNGKSAVGTTAEEVVKNAKSGDTITVLKGTTLSNVPTGVKVTNGTSDKITVNGTEVAANKEYVKKPSSGGGSYTPSGHEFTTTLQNINKVSVGGKVLDSKYYTVIGTNVIISQEYIDKLSNGSYTVVIENATHRATGTLKVSGNKSVTSAKTFDAGIALYAGMALSSAMGAAYICTKKKK